MTIQRSSAPDPGRRPDTSGPSIDQPGAQAAGGSRSLPTWTIWSVSALLAAAGLILLIGHLDRDTSPAGTGQPVSPVDTIQAPQSLPSAPASSTRQQAPPTKPSPSAGVGSSTPWTGDPLAGAVPDSMIQDLLDQAQLTNVAPELAAVTRAAAWKDLAADLQTGGWRKPHLQAAATTAAGANTTDPAAVDVIVIWSATDPAGQFVDRRRSTVRLLHTSDTWTTDRIS